MPSCQTKGGGTQIKIELTDSELAELRRVLKVYWSESLCDGDWEQWNEQTGGDYTQEDFKEDINSFKKLEEKF